MPHIHDAPANSQYQMMSVQGVSLRVYTRDIDQPGVPLVICNGLGQSVEILYPVLHELPDRPVIAFDAAGVGRSECPDEPTSIAQHADMLSEVVDQLGVAEIDLMGISWGGAVAQQVARDHPGRVRKLVLSITSAGGVSSWWGSPVALFEIMFPMRYMNKTYGNFIGPFMYGGEAMMQPGLFREYSRHAVRPTYKGYAAQVQALCSWSSLPWLRSLNVPTQVIGGAQDTLIPIANQMMLAAMIPNARFRVFAAGHLLMYSRRCEVGKLVTGFLGD